MDRVASTVASYGIDRSLIEIEITESAREENEALLRAVTEGLHDLGFRVAIDDFGVDNASFQLFFQLGFDVLKLDKSLVWGPRHHRSHHAGDLQPGKAVRRSGHRDGCRGDRDRRAAPGLAGGRLHARAGLPGGDGPQPIEEFERRFLAT